MDLGSYVNDLQHQLEVAAQAGGEDARALAERLIAPLESATRLVLLEALSVAASEITRELAPGSVDLRLRGRDPEFVVSAPPVSLPFEEAAAREGLSVNAWLVRTVAAALEPKTRRPAQHAPLGGDRYTGWVR